MTARQVPIGEHGLIGDTRSAALVAPDGAIDWCCLPRFDSPPVFGRLVGGETAGWFGIGPAQPATATDRCYRAGTATLCTTWQLDGGTLTLEDSFVAEVTGRLLPGTLLVRRLVSHGRPVPVRLHLAPRFGYDHRPAARVGRRAGMLVAERGALAIAVGTDADADVVLDRDVVFTVDPARPITVVLTASHRGPVIALPPGVARAAAERDETGWRRWSGDLAVPAARRELVVRSYLTLRLLTYSPSGAPVAAPTTSLPEHLGGSRNWDYRFAWPRDASIGVAAFLQAGRHHEAAEFLAWLLHASRVARPRLPALLTIDGRPGTREQILEGWPGYAGSRPVRAGNGATDQHQLDGYGWVLDAAWLFAAAGHHLSGELRRALAGFADRVATVWPQPDAGIWERRDSPRHHVHSKLMAWLALDRAARIAELTGGRRSRADRWSAERDRLAADVRTRGYSEELGAYTAAYGSCDLDAAVLLLPLVGIEPPGSPRLAGTVDAIRSRLGAGGPLLYRYLDDDGLPGREGAFLPCSFWLVQALAALGRLDEANDLFDDLAGRASRLGLYGEEMDPSTGEHLGNFPQALTHAALLQAAAALAEA